MGRLHRLSSRIAVAVVLALVVPRTLAAAPSGLDRAKQVYGEAMAALEAKDYATATMKFEQAYQFAPDKHLFNYNIASAAELAGDCRKAQKHYKMFLDLVPEHAARKEVTRTLEKLDKSCVYDDEGVSTLQIESRSDREAERSKAGAQRALDEALEATRQSVVRYQAVVTRHGKAQPFVRVLRAKRRDEKKVVKLFAGLGFEAEEYRGEVAAPESLEQACRQGQQQEERNAAAYSKAYEKFDDADVAKLMDKLARRAEGPHLRAFSEGCPRK